jgi:hypothetical protein
MLRVSKQIPEEFFGEQRVALLVGVGQAVAGRRGDAEACEDRALRRSPSHTSLRPMARESWAKSIAAR